MARTFTVSMVRESLSEALDQAEGGEPVFIERRGVRYRLTVEPKASKPRRAAPRIQVLDKAVEAGEWTWDWQGRDLRFRARRR